MGFTGIAMGIALLMVLPAGVCRWSSCWPPSLIGAGLGAASVASTQTGTDAADPAYRGVTSGVLNSAAQVGTAVGVALLVPLAAATAGPAVMTSYRIGFLGACAIALAGALSSLLVPVRPASDRSPHRSGNTPEEDAAAVEFRIGRSPNCDYLLELGGSSSKAKAVMRE